MKIYSNNNEDIKDIRRLIKLFLDPSHKLGFVISGGWSACLCFNDSMEDYIIQIETYINGKGFVDKYYPYSLFKTITPLEIYKDFQL
jgi:hypothetical protein